LGGAGADMYNCICSTERRKTKRVRREEQLLLN
jgi:hypothetical protein